MRCAAHMGTCFPDQLGDTSTAPSFVCRDDVERAIGVRRLRHLLATMASPNRYSVRADRRRLSFCAIDGSKSGSMVCAQARRSLCARVASRKRAMKRCLLTYNRIALVGNPTHDLEIRYVDGGGGGRDVGRFLRLHAGISCGLMPPRRTARRPLTIQSCEMRLICDDHPDPAERGEHL